MRPPDLGPDAFAFRQERDEAERARAPSTIATAKPARKVKRVIDPNDSRPKIRLCANDIERIVNECESALIKANRGLYQRHGSIVFVDSVPALAAHGVKVQVQRISERGEQALQEDFSSAACFEKFDARADDLVLTDPPMSIVRTLLARRGRLRLPILSGVINTPTMRADGSILDTPGYDTGTGLLFDPLGVMFPAIKGSPSRDDALAALGKLQDIIRWFPFVEPQHRSVALSAFLTACIRRSLPSAPLHGYTAPVPGSGKSKLVDIASVIATGVEAPVTAPGKDEEELEKRLVASLLAADPIITIDNCARPIGGDLLCQMMTQPLVRPRILGKSEAPTCSTGSLCAATGNNLVLAGDLIRRSIISRLDPKVERPELLVFDFDPSGPKDARYFRRLARKMVEF